MRKWIGVTVVAAALILLGALPVSAGQDGGAAPLTVRKVVAGPVPAGTQFVVTVACEGSEEGEPIIDTGNGPASSVQFVFDAQGNPVGTGDTVTFVDGGQCTVTETQTGGAASVIYECVGTFPPAGASQGVSGRFGPRPLSPCESSGPQSEPIRVFIQNEDQEATVTVTNTFVTPPESPQPPPSPPEAAAPVVAAPRFTG